VPLGEGIHLEQGHQRRVSSKKSFLSPIDTSSVKNGCRKAQTCCLRALLTSYPVVPTSMTLNHI